MLKTTTLLSSSIFFSNKNVHLVFSCSGSMSFEYAMEGVFSIKSDVYSFGVLMLEIVCSRKNNSFYNDEHALNLVGYVRIIYIYIYIRLWIIYIFIVLCFQNFK